MSVMESADWVAVRRADAETALAPLMLARAATTFAA